MDRKQMANALMGYADITTADVLNTPIRKGSVLPFTEYADRSEFDPSAGVLGSMGRAFTAPARAYRGELTDDQMIDEGANLAGWLTLGGYMSPKPANALGAGGSGIKAYRGVSEYPAHAHGRNETFFSSSPEVASGYAADPLGTGSPAVMRSNLELGRSAEVDAGGAIWSRIPVASVAEDLVPFLDDVSGNYTSTNSIASAARKAGYDSATISNVMDDALDRAIDPSTVYALFDPKSQILRKYGLLGPVGAGVVAGVTNDEGPIY